MLSRVHDTRVFTGSHDVVYSDAADRDAHKRLAQRPSYHHQHLGPATADDADDANDCSSDALSADDSAGSADEYEYFRDSRHPPSAALHPHHPYNTQLRALAPSPRAAAGGTVATRSSSSRRHDPSAAPMEFVYLPSGEIRPRDECPPGLLLPPPASSAPQAIAADAYRSDRLSREHHQPQRTSRSDAAHTHRASASGQTRQAHMAASVSSDSSSSSSSASEAPVRRRRDNNRHASDRSGHYESRQDESSSSSEHESGGSGASEDESDREDRARDEKENVQQQQTRHGHRDVDKRLPSTVHASVAHTTKTASDRGADRRLEHRRAAPSSSERLRRSGDADDTSARAQQQQEPRRQPATAPRETEHEPPAAHLRKRATKQQTPPDAHAAKSTKLDVRDLLSDHAPLRAPRARSASSSAAATAALRKQVADLERALQSEKQRVLETMTQVLDAQRTAQDRARDVARLEAQLAATDHDVERRIRDAVGNETAHWSARVSALEAAVASKDAAVATLETQLEQARSAAASRPKPHDVTLQQQQMEKIVAKLRKFHARAERWKRSSRAATDVCATPADVASLLDALWRDFPALPLRELVATDASPDASSRPSSAHEPAHMVAFLTKRLRLREDELAQTHAKYGELKELCARQCVREADLQNFINEHRLRGNLVIRNTVATTATAAAGDTNDAGDAATDDRRKTVQFHAQGGEQRPRERSARASTSRATNTPPVYFAGDDDDDDDGEGGDGDRAEDEQSERGSGDDDDGGEGYDCDEDEASEAQSAYLVREPKVFVQVGRDGVFEHAGASSAVLRKLEDERMRQQLASRSSARSRRDVERIRLVPSPALARRYERVPAAAEPRRRAPSAAATPVRSSTRSSGRQPPSISATRSASSAARRRAPPPLPRASGSVRSGSVTSSRNSRIAAAPWV